MKRCNVCGKEMSEFATECPHCKGKGNEDGKSLVASNPSIVQNIKTVLISGVILFVVILLMDVFNTITLSRYVGFDGAKAYELFILELNPITQIIGAGIVFFIGNIIAHKVKPEADSKFILYVKAGCIVVYMILNIILGAIINYTSIPASSMPYVDGMKNMIPISCGLMFGAIMFSTMCHIEKKAFLKLVGVLIISLIIYVICTTLMVSAMMLGTNSVYNIVTALAVALFTVVPHFMFK